MPALFRWPRAITERYQDMDELHDLGEIDLHISGCINSCGHHHSGHIGILGVDKDGKEWYQVSLGGADGSHLSGAAVAGKVVGPSFAATEVADVHGSHAWTCTAKQRHAGETFVQTLQARRPRSPSRPRPTVPAKPQPVPRPEKDPMKLLTPDTVRQHWRQRPCPGLGQRRWTRKPNEIAGVARIELHFPKFSDGRAFSQAFLLRRRMGFAGRDWWPPATCWWTNSHKCSARGFDTAVLRADQSAGHRPARAGQLPRLCRGPLPRRCQSVAAALQGGRMSAVHIYGRRSADFEAKLAETVAVLQRAAAEFSTAHASQQLGRLKTWSSPTCCMPTNCRQAFLCWTPASCMPRRWP